MSGSEGFDQISENDLNIFKKVCAALRYDAATQNTQNIPDEVVPMLLTAGTLAFRAIIQEEKRPLNVFEDGAEITPTAVVVAVSAMLRAVDLNSFDLAMWFTATPPPPSPRM